MKIDRMDLLNALTLVQPAVSSKEIIEQSTCLIFTNGKVITYNDVVSITHPVDLEIEGAVKADELIKLLGKMKDKEIDVKVGKEGLVLKAEKGKRKACIRLEAEITLPIDEVDPPDDWNTLPEGFNDAIEFCRFSASRDLSKPLLVCVHVKKDRVESTDNFRLTRKMLSDEVPDEMLLPAESIQLIVAQSPVEYVLTDGWAHFRNENKVVVSTRVYEGEYPNLAPLLKMKEGNEIQIPASLKDALDRARIFSKLGTEPSERIYITLDGKNMTIRGEGESGWFEEKCKVRWDGEGKVSFATHPDFLKAAVEKAAVLKIDEKRGHLTMEGKDWEHLMTLIAS